MEHYEVITKLGNGSCGAVYLVRHLDTKKLYALKKIQLDERRKTRTKEAVLREARILAQLKHPNIVAYRDSFFDDLEENLCIIQDYCDGGTLDEVISEAARKNNYFSEKQIIQWFIQLAMAVQYIHSKKILHRDLKTQNVFLTKKKICKIGDFGISKMMDQTVDMAKTCVGTPCYLAPEMCQDIPYSSKADVWALGCLLYEMCALHPAFEANNLISLFHKIVQGSYEPLPTRYSEPLSELIRIILVKNPDERPSARQILTLPYIREMLVDFIEEKQCQLEQKAMSRDSPSNRNTHRTRAAMLSKNNSREPSHSPVSHKQATSRSDRDQTADVRKSLPQKSEQEPRLHIEGGQTSRQPAKKNDVQGAGLTGDCEDYEDDFEDDLEEECEEATSTRPDSDEDIPEDLSSCHDDSNLDVTDASGEDNEEDDDEYVAEEYVDDFEEDEEELGDLVSHALEVREFDQLSNDKEDETVVDDTVSPGLQSCKQYLQQHGLMPLKRNRGRLCGSTLGQISEEHAGSTSSSRSTCSTETEICYLIEEIFGDLKQ